MSDKPQGGSEIFATGTFDHSPDAGVDPIKEGADPDIIPARPWHTGDNPFESLYQHVVGEIARVEAMLTGSKKPSTKS